jgi:putative membrane protein
MILVDILPSLNAALNAISAGLALAGYRAIRHGRQDIHRLCMLSALGSSTLFLAGYLTLRAVAGLTRYTGEGWIRPVYFSLLLSHTVLAAVQVPLLGWALYRAWQGAFARHRTVARVALPTWLYVSATGVLVYWILYRLPIAR